MLPILGRKAQLKEAQRFDSLTDDQFYSISMFLMERSAQIRSIVAGRTVCDDDLALIRLHRDRTSISLHDSPSL